MKKYSMLMACVLGACLSPVVHADELQDIKAKKTLVCGVLGDSVPLGFQDPATRQTVGLDVDICKQLAKDMGVSPEITPISVDARIASLQTGRVNVVLAALGYTRERAKQIDFSSAYYQMPIKILVQNNSDITKFSQFAGKRVSAIRGSTPELYARQQLTGATVLTFDDAPSAFMALMQNKVQGMAMSEPAAVRFHNRSTGKTRFLDESLHFEPNCVGVKKGEAGLLAAVNDSLNSMEKSGQLQTVWDKWYGQSTEYKIAREKKLTPLSDFQ
ncbi:L-cystine-binding protein FliY [Paraburkholderia aspalathi]|uniref:transporter substrate-binding domain-containing protein n=1 Tax=Paraburkholderia aspalathi TaxID=1324617 RepID=UPI001B04494F|nr:transporter substrate-binding domain-containing protein [Paraburkholderia aspalathi]CAE6850852.1 L-cystine-binding protein FliY [Paraburkholderia aspalathi]